MDDFAIIDWVLQLVNSMGIFPTVLSNATMKDCNPLAGDSLDVCIAQHNKRWTTPEVQGSSRTNAIAVIAWILFIEAYLSVSG